MIILDTSVVVDAFASPFRSLASVRAAISAGERLAIPTLVLYEWLRGPRHAKELDLQDMLLPASQAIEFGATEASIAANLFRTLPSAKARAMDLAIASCALPRGAALWTLNLRDFADIPGLEVSTPA